MLRFWCLLSPAGVKRESFGKTSVRLKEELQVFRQEEAAAGDKCVKCHRLVVLDVVYNAIAH